MLSANLEGLAAAAKEVVCCSVGGQVRAVEIATGAVESDRGCVVDFLNEMSTFLRRNLVQAQCVSAPEAIEGSEVEQGGVWRECVSVSVFRNGLNEGLKILWAQSFRNVVREQPGSSVRQICHC